MKKTLLSLAVIASVFSAFAQNVGIGTNTPQTKLDINGALSTRMTSVPAAATVTIPDNVTLFRLTNTTGGSATALSLVAPKEGQLLIVINEDDNDATLNGYVIPAGTPANPSVGNFINIGGVATGWKRSADNNTGSNSFTAGDGLSWSGNTLNSVWSKNGNDIYNNNSSNKVGIGTNAPAGTLDVQGGTAPANTNGNNVILQAQSGGSGTSVGGSVSLTSGTGTVANGIVDINSTGPGGVNIANNNTDTKTVNIGGTATNSVVNIRSGSAGGVNVTGNESVSGNVTVLGNNVYGNTSGDQNMNLSSRGGIRMVLDNNSNGSEDFAIQNNNGASNVFTVTEAGNFSSTGNGTVDGNLTLTGSSARDLNLNDAANLKGSSGLDIILDNDANNNGVELNIKTDGDAGTKLLTVTDGGNVKIPALNNSGTKIVTVDATGTLAAGVSASGLVPTSTTITINNVNNQTTVTGGTQDLSNNRTWTVGTVQDIAPASSPTFNTLQLNGLTASSSVYTDASKNLTTTAPNNGTIGFWNRDNGNGYLSPATLADRVGVGTANPASKLDVQGGYIRVSDIQNPASTDQAFMQGSAGVAYFGALSTQRASFGNAESYETLTADDGYIGIRTNAPTTTLDVNGSIRLRGASPAAGKVLTATDAAGNAVWSTKVSSTSSSAATGGTGWKRIATIANGLRGFGAVSIYTEGGSYTPCMATIYWSHDWSAGAGLNITAPTNSAYWSDARITDDGSNSFIEVNFVSDISLSMLSDDYGWNTATLYAGTLPAGGGNVRATAKMGRLNFGEDDLFVDYTGRVGIGTNAPQTTLDVSSTTGGPVILRTTTTETDIDYEAPSGGWQVGTNNSGNGTNNNQFFIYGNGGTGYVASFQQGTGNVGIGTLAPQKRLDVRSNANDVVTVGAATMGVGQWTGIHFGYREDNTLYRKSAIVFERTDNSGGGGNASGKVHILNGPATGSGSATLADAKLTIGELGNVGMGTTSPAAGVEVYNMVNWSSGWRNNLRLTSDDYPSMRFYATGSNKASMIGNNNDGGLWFAVNGNGDAAGSFAMVIEQGGDIGIGTSGPNYKLDVNGTFNIQSNNWAYANGIQAFRNSYFGYNSVYQGIQIGNGTANHGLFLQYDPTGNPSGQFSNGREIVIGNNIPILAPVAANNDYRHVLTYGSDNKLHLGSQGSYASYALNIDDAGNVGIGTSSPIGKFNIFAGGATGVSWGTGFNIGDASNYSGLIQDGGTSRWRNWGAGGFDWYSNGGSQIMALSNTGELKVGSGVKFPDNTVQTTAVATANFMGYLANASTIVTNNAGTAEFTTAQNTDAAVFETLAGGGIRIKKAGIISWNYDQDIIVNGGSYAYLYASINSSALFYSIIAPTGGYWDGVHNGGSYAVAANDVLYHTWGAASSDIASMDNGVWGTLSITWMGAK